MSDARALATRAKAIHDEAVELGADTLADGSPGFASHMWTGWMNAKPDSAEFPFAEWLRRSAAFSPIGNYLAPTGSWSTWLAQLAAWSRATGYLHLADEDGPDVHAALLVLAGRTEVPANGLGGVAHFGRWKKFAGDKLRAEKTRQKDMGALVHESLVGVYGPPPKLP